MTEGNHQQNPQLVWSAPGFAHVTLLITVQCDEFRSALCSVHSKIYRRSHVTVGGSQNKSLKLQPQLRCYCKNSGSSASACVMRRHCPITYTGQLHAINGILAAGRVGNLFCGCPSYTIVHRIVIIFHRNRFLKINFYYTMLAQTVAYVPQVQRLRDSIPGGLENFIMKNFKRQVTNDGGIGLRLLIARLYINGLH